jgi:hypothetical protein
MKVIQISTSGCDELAELFDIERFYGRVDPRYFIFVWVPRSSNIAEFRELEGEPTSLYFGNPPVEAIGIHQKRLHGIIPLLSGGDTRLHDCQRDRMLDGPALPSDRHSDIWGLDLLLPCARSYIQLLVKADDTGMFALLENDGEPLTSMPALMTLNKSEIRTFETKEADCGW